MSVEAIGKRVIRRLIELVVAIAVIGFVVSRPDMKADLPYFLGSVAILFFCLSVLRKWP